MTGWDGLCVEPEPMYHAGLKANRTCMLIPECISDTDKTVTMMHAGVDASVTNDKGKQNY